MKIPKFINTIDEKKTIVPVEQNTGNSEDLNHIKKYENLIKGANDYDSFYRVFNDLSEQKIGSFVNDTTYKINDIYIFLGLKNDADYYKELLTKLNNEKISFAPKYISSVKSKSGFSATFTQIKGTDNANLKDFNKVYSCVPIQKKEKAYNDIKKLLKMGIMNNRIILHNAFEVIPNSYDIVISDWDSVFYIPSKNDALEYLNIARETLFRK